MPGCIAEEAVNLRSNRIAVTGAEGFIGSHLQAAPTIATQLPAGASDAHDV